ncbi:hypothetical protein SAMN05519104_7977 [Rhizobiales bacterium GAS188]|nr:hypothetical protein SAMN05519104_7977 [Rhizobiales bacterium GAS188]
MAQLPLEFVKIDGLSGGLQEGHSGPRNNFQPRSLKAVSSK